MPDTKRLLELALKGLEVERDRLNREIDELKSRLTGTTPAAPARKRRAKKKRRHMTTAQRKLISERMKANWAKRRAKKKR